MTGPSPASRRAELGASVAFAFVDVFADRPLTGNPLAVIPDADRLTAERMRAIAREFNQSETTFLLRPTRDDADHRLRSFTAAGHEVGGAGHNALGAWLWLADTGTVAAGNYRQQIGDAVLDVDVERDPHGRTSVSMTQSPPHSGATVDRVTPLAAALGIGDDHLDHTLPARVVSTGVAHLLVALTERETVDRVNVDANRLREILAAYGGEGCYVYTTAGPHGDGASNAYARFFNPTMGIVEDPATGTAAGPLAAYLVQCGHAADGSTVVIDQGYVSGRPSRLRVTVTGDTVRLSGSGMIVAEGRISV